VSDKCILLAAGDCFTVWAEIYAKEKKKSIR